VVTGLTASFEYKPPPPDPSEAGHFYPNPEIRTWALHLLPDRADKLAMKLGDESVLTNLHVVEMRGRERTFFERVQRYLF
jgi:hypothetical protein